MQGNYVKLMGHSVPEKLRDDVFALAKSGHFGALVTLFHIRHTDKNRLQGITGQPFADGKTVGMVDGIQSDLNFLLGISKEADTVNND